MRPQNLPHARAPVTPFSGELGGLRESPDVLPTGPQEVIHIVGRSRTKLGSMPNLAEGRR